MLLLFGTALQALAAQEIPPPGTEQQFENIASTEESETEDDSYLQQLTEFKKHPIQLNSTDGAELKELKMLSPLQIEQFLSYRHIFGKLINIYELQAVPGWDIITIRKILPYISLGEIFPLKIDLKKRVTNGDKQLLIRCSQVMEKAQGYRGTGTGNTYAGSRPRIFFRYRYQYKNLFQYGINGDKDAGEQFFKGKQKIGFDFYSFHVFAKSVGNIQALALGDFTVNMGQGLIQWQSLGFKKSSEVISIKRESPVLRPYNSGGEIIFHRGIGISIKKGKSVSTVYFSLRKLSANTVKDSLHQTFISSILITGYHRTENELKNRNNVSQMSTGFSFLFKETKWHIAMNGVYYKFSLPINKADQPYNLYSIKGSEWFNISTDYSLTWRNLHFFGEAAADKFLNTAFLNAILISVDRNVDLSFLHRMIKPAYQAIGGNSFTENSYPSNETGLYGSISVRPASGWRLDGYFDLFKFPWLKYLVDAPSGGKEFLVQLTYMPSRNVEIYCRYRNEQKQRNQSSGSAITLPVKIPKQNWRTHISYTMNRTITIRNRIEFLNYNKKDSYTYGFLIYLDGVYKPALKPYSGNLRVQYFEIDDFDSRIYGYENDVIYSFSIPSFVGKGYRYYINLSYAVNKRVSIWAKFSQTIYTGKKSVNNEMEEIKGNKKSELRLQAIWNVTR